MNQESWNSKFKKILLFILILLFCTNLLSCREREKLNINLKLIPISNPKDLPKTALPNPKIQPVAIVKDIPNLPHFSKLLKEFSHKGDKLITEIFTPILKRRNFELTVIATQGIPEPYDAWTATYKNQKAFFFNMDMWSKEDLKKHGLPVIKHEITHVLLDEFLTKPDESDPIAVLEYLILNEGIAHYIGFSKNRSALLTDYKDKWLHAEKTLVKARKKLKNSDLNKNEKEKLLQEANTGKYWDKFAAISGMFRTANIYQSKGADGLIDLINKWNQKIKSGTKLL
jgi:hypothetical protein